MPLLQTKSYDVVENFHFESVAKVLLVLAVPVFGIIAGYVASTGDWINVALVGAGIVSIAIAMLPRAVFWLTVFTAIVIAGLARMYVPEAENVRWLVPIGAWLLAAHAFAHVALYYGTSRRSEFTQPVPSLLYWAVAFMVVILLSGALHWPGEETFIKGVKGYFQMWGLLFALALYPWPRELVDRLPRFFVLIALLQLPFVIHQYLYLVPLREVLARSPDNAIIPVDIIAGTFGGKIDGGGLNATLSAFLFVVLAGILSTWRKGLLRWYWALPIMAVLLVPSILNVAKVSVFYALIVFLVVFGSDIVRSPKHFVSAIAMVAGVLVLLLWAYTFSASMGQSSWQELIENTYKGNIEEDLGPGGLTRAGALRYWAEHQELEKLPEMFIGYGPGTTRSDEETVASTEVDDGPVDREINVAKSTVSGLLWEGGLLGVLCLFGLLASTFLTAARLAKASEEDEKMHAIFLAAKAGVLVLFVSLWHNNTFMFDVGSQAVLLLVVGYLAYWSRRIPLSEKQRRRRCW